MPTLSHADPSPQDLEACRRSLEARLHPSYLILADAVAPLREPWARQPAQAHADAARRFYANESSWMGAVPELMGQAQALEADCRRVSPSPHPPVLRQSTTWWRRQIDQARHQVVLAPWLPRDVTTHGLRCASEVLGLDTEVLQRVERHRDRVLELPERVTESDAASLVRWLGVTLPAIDPVVAGEIRFDDPVLRCLIDEGEALVLCMDYLGLMVEVLPPQLYAHVAGPGASHVLTQSVWSVACAFLGSPTAFAQTRHLAGRLLALEPLLEDEADRAPWVAIKEFADHLEEFTNAATELHTLGEMVAHLREPATTADDASERSGWWRSVMQKVGSRHRG